jgi:tRNA(fMet)-specific endonuclease VapC
VSAEGPKPRHLLDTNICIYIAKARPPAVARRFARAEVGTLAMSAITWGELCFGAERSRSVDQARAALASFAAVVPPRALPAAAGDHYGRVRAELASRGQPIGNNDLWIAAHALAEDLILVTHNTREFKRVPGLKLEDWA